MIRKNQQNELQKPEIKNSSKNSEPPLSALLSSITHKDNGAEQLGNRRTNFNTTSENESANTKHAVPLISWIQLHFDQKDPRKGHISKKMFSDSLQLTTFARLYYTKKFNFDNERRNSTANLETHNINKEALGN